jgi:hypothetical protein
VLVDLGGLTPTSRGARIPYNGAQRTVIDGPFAEPEEEVAGYLILEVKTFVEATEWAKRSPFGISLNQGEQAEVGLRLLFDPSKFDVPGEAEDRTKKLEEKAGRRSGGGSGYVAASDLPTCRDHLGRDACDREIRARDVLLLQKTSAYSVAVQTYLRGRLTYYSYPFSEETSQI